jgi:hypothetical protein
MKTTKMSMIPIVVVFDESIEKLGD